MANVTDRQAAADVQLMVGGNFTPDALGPAHEQTLARVRAAADRYLKVFEQLYLARPMDVNQHSNLYLGTFLRALADVAPDKVATLARRLVQQTDTALAARGGAAGGPAASEGVAEETSRMLDRVEMRQRELRSLTRR